MKSGKLTNVLLALIFLALLVHLVIPMFGTDEASAAGRASVSPSQAAADVGIPPMYADMINKISAALGDIAKSNKEIATAVRDNTRANAEIARSLDGLTRQMSALSSGSPAPKSHAPAPQSGESDSRSDEESNPGWWRQYMDE
jgi:hypothetical protein